jgi:hypothetical protein
MGLLQNSHLNNKHIPRRLLRKPTKLLQKKIDNSINIPHQDLLNKIMNSPSTHKLLALAKKSKNETKILYPKELHSTYNRFRKGTKVVTINTNHPIKKMIINKVITAKNYNDLINQQDKIEVNDPLGLYMVLKNIQKRRCSIGYICVEVGN